MQLRLDKHYMKYCVITFCITFVVIKLKLLWLIGALVNMYVHLEQIIVDNLSICC